MSFAEAIILKLASLISRFNVLFDNIYLTDLKSLHTIELIFVLFHLILHSLYNKNSAYIVKCGDGED